MTHLFVTDIVDEIFISNHFSKRLYQIRITIIKDWITNRRCTESSHKPSKIYRMVIKTANTDSLFRSIPVVIKRTDKMTAVNINKPVMIVFFMISLQCQNDFLTISRFSRLLQERVFSKMLIWFAAGKVDPLM